MFLYIFAKVVTEILIRYIILGHIFIYFVSAINYPSFFSYLSIHYLPILSYSVQIKRITLISNMQRTQGKFKNICAIFKNLKVIAVKVILIFYTLAIMT